MNDSDRNQLVIYRIKKANDTLNEIEFLVAKEFFNTAVNRLYYACYYAVIALLVKNEINAQTHHGVRQMFGLHFIKTGLIKRESGQFYSDIFDKRQTSDYDDFIDYSFVDVIALIEPAKELIKEIERQIKE
jgi:uncharacterized protein (UPF0332 family)